MNLAVRDVQYRLGRFLLTTLGLGLLLGVVMAMGGIYRGLLEDAVSIVRAPAADLWIVQKDTNGPFAETSRIPEDVYRVIAAVPGVREASPIAFQPIYLHVSGKSIRVQLIGYRPGALGAPPAVVAGRPILRPRYEMVIDVKAGVPLGTEIAIDRLTLTVVGLIEGIVSNTGDPVAYVSLQDAQEIQFLKANEAVRNERARLETSLKADPVLQAVPAFALEPVVQNTHLANAVLARLQPWADPSEVTDHIERWNHYRAMTTEEQGTLLVRTLVEQVRRQILLFRTILVVVSTVIIALILYTMTLEKTRDIATLKIIGAPNSKIGGLILQEALALGLLGFALGAVLVHHTHEYFPRRVVILSFDLYVLFGIVVGVSVLASLLGIRKALKVEATIALGGGA